MSADSADRARRNRLLAWSVALLAAFVLAWFGITCARILRQARHDESRPAAAIVVFGAAEYSGRPSPIYRARLDHAYELFHKGLAPVVITTGGSGYDPNYSEGGVGRDYLRSLGVPDRDLIAETQGADTVQSAQRVAVIMKANRLRDCLAVSDAYHVFRVKQMLEGQGVRVYAAPRPDSLPHAFWERSFLVGREAISYMLWRLGFNV
ncbi:MAG TPA: YdcF family protein [Terriglobales bacterium]|nr:YdcF family protein [Terriglobales bacterium]